MSSWVATAADAATAAGTLILAVATFVSVRSSQRAARANELALLAGIRPVLVNSSVGDADQKVGFIDGHWVRLPGGHASAEVGEDAVYLLISLRNAGNGLAVLDRWQVWPGRRTEAVTLADTAGYRRLTRDIYVAGGQIGFWQGALRNTEDPDFAAVADIIRDHGQLTVDILYGDHQGGQRTVSRFGLVPTGEGQWLAAASRHWNLDRPDPR